MTSGRHPIPEELRFYKYFYVSFVSIVYIKMSVLKINQICQNQKNLMNYYGL